MNLYKKDFCQFTLGNSSTIDRLRGIVAGSLKRYYNNNDKLLNKIVA